MKILRIIESFYPYVSGPANQAFMISKLLEKRGLKSPVFTTRHKAEESPNEEKIDGVDVRRFSIRASLMKYFITPKLDDAIKKEKPDIVHCHNYRSYQTQHGFIYAKKNSKPFVLNTHGSLLGYDHIVSGLKKLPYKLYDTYGKKIAKEADIIIVSSRQEREEAIRFGVDEENIKVIPMGISVSEYSKVKKTRVDGKYVLLFVGRISRDRNLMPIIRAVERLDDKDIELRIVGGSEKRSDTEKSGYLDELKKYVSSRKLNAVFTGPKYGDELKKEYKNADVFIYTSLYENFGQTLLEAGASGLPIISTDVGVAPEILDKEFIVDIDSLVDDRVLVEKIAALKDAKTRAAIGRKIRERVIKGFNWEDVIMEYEKVYVKVSR